MSVAIVLFLIVLNGLFAMAEIAVVSSNRFKLQQRAQEGDLAAARALALAENPNRFLSTVQIGITLVGVFAGAFGGTTLAGPVAEWLSEVPLLAPYANGLAFALVVMVITYLSLVIGELVPKRVGLSNPEGIASRLAGLMHGISVGAAPLVWFLGASTELLLRVLRIRPKEETISEEEIDMVISQGRRAGVVEPAEQEIIENAFWLGERTVRSIMTPRHRVSWLDLETGPEEVRALVKEAPHRRYLLRRGGTDEVVGYVDSTDMLNACLTGGVLELGSLVREPLIVPETLPVLAMLERFRATGIHMAVVYDEYGGFEGLVTLGDILEELVGDVVDPDSSEPPEFQELREGEWLVNGSLHVDELLDLLNLGGEVDLDAEGFETVGGLLASRLGRIPQLDDAVGFHGHRLLVQEMSGLRVLQVLVTVDPEGDGPVE